jgi:hypothetical protein
VCGPASNVYGDVPQCGASVDSTAVAAPSNGNQATLNVDADPTGTSARVTARPWPSAGATSAIC